MNLERIQQPVDKVRTSFDLVLEKLYSWVESGISLLPNLVVALIVVILFALLGRLVRKLTTKVLQRVMASQAMTRLLATLAGMSVVIIGIFFALGVLQLDKTVTSLLAGAGVIGIGLAFAFQDLAANLIAGFYMSFRRPFVPGDLVETNDTFGTVQHVDLRSTMLRTPQGQSVIIPNKEIFENRLINYTRSGERRVDLPVGVSYGEDLEKVRKVAIEAIEGLEERDKERPVELFYDAFGSSSIDFTVRFWIDFARQVDYRRARSEAVIRIKAAFDAHDITIPFPIRTLDFGIRGGETVTDALAPLVTLRTRGSNQDGSAEGAQTEN